jgi:hypothetical protein
MSTQSFPLSGPINLSARLAHGSLLVRAVDDVKEATVELTGPAEVVDRVTVELKGPTLVVHAPRQGGLADLVANWRMPGMSDARVDAVVTVPTGTALKIATFTAPVTVEGRVSGGELSSGTAPITIDEVEGDLQMQYGTADATVGKVGGSVTIRSGSGNARLGEIGRNLTAGFGRGKLVVDRVRGAVHARSGAGEATLGAVHGDVDVASGAGSMSIGLPAGVTVHVDVTTGRGEVRSELPIEAQPAQPKGAITVRARTGRGDVRLFRAA